MSATMTIRPRPTMPRSSSFTARSGPQSRGTAGQVPQWLLDQANDEHFDGGSVARSVTSERSRLSSQMRPQQHDDASEMNSTLGGSSYGGGSSYSGGGGSARSMMSSSYHSRTSSSSRSSRASEQSERQQQLQRQQQQHDQQQLQQRLREEQEELQRQQLELRQREQQLREQEEQLLRQQQEQQDEDPSVQLSDSDGGKPWYNRKASLDTVETFQADNTTAAGNHDSASGSILYPKDEPYEYEYEAEEDDLPEEYVGEEQDQEKHLQQQLRGLYGQINQSHQPQHHPQQYSQEAEYYDQGDGGHYDAGYNGGYNDGWDDYAATEAATEEDQYHDQYGTSAHDNPDEFYYQDRDTRPVESDGRYRHHHGVDEEYYQYQREEQPPNPLQQLSELGIGLGRMVNSVKQELQKQFEQFEKQMVANGDARSANGRNKGTMTADRRDGFGRRPSLKRSTSATGASFSSRSLFSSWSSKDLQNTEPEMDFEEDLYTSAQKGDAICLKRSNRGLSGTRRARRGLAPEHSTLDRSIVDAIHSSNRHLIVDEEPGAFNDSIAPFNSSINSFNHEEFQDSALPLSENEGISVTSQQQNSSLPPLPHPAMSESRRRVGWADEVDGGVAQETDAQNAYEGKEEEGDDDLICGWGDPERDEDHYDNYQEYIPYDPLDGNNSGNNAEFKDDQDPDDQLDDFSEDQSEKWKMYANNSGMFDYVHEQQRQVDDNLYGEEDGLICGFGHSDSKEENEYYVDEQETHEHRNNNDESQEQTQDDVVYQSFQEMPPQEEQLQTNERLIHMQMKNQLVQQPEDVPSPQDLHLYTPAAPQNPQPKDIILNEDPEEDTNERRVSDLTLRTLEFNQSGLNMSSDKLFALGETLDL